MDVMDDYTSQPAGYTWRVLGITCLPHLRTSTSTFCSSISRSSRFIISTLKSDKPTETSPIIHFTSRLLNMSGLAIDSTFKLPSGKLMPKLGFGVYQARGSDCQSAVEAAIKSGYRHSWHLSPPP